MDHRRLVLCAEQLGGVHNQWIKPLLDNGADVNSTDGRSQLTAIRTSAMNVHVNCLTTLVRHGADDNDGACASKVKL